MKKILGFIALMASFFAYSEVDRIDSHDDIDGKQALEVVCMEGATFVVYQKDDLWFFENHELVNLASHDISSKLVAYYLCED